MSSTTIHAGDVDHHLLIGDSTSLPVLEQAVRSFQRPAGRLQAWCAAEAGSSVRSARTLSTSSV
ncbi:hypothetical protein [Kribbella sp. C-35]|uniref:hypothetical protein n=1 Tax=Kribbella sp. C-35 TaxID=2789276 RepID=UPI00397B9D3F